MTLKGQLQHFSLGELFQTLALNQHTGTLVLKNETEEKSIYFANGYITRLATGSGLRLGDMLLREGYITQIDLEDAIREQKRTGKLLGKILVDLGKVEDEDISAAMRLRVEEELYELFLWETGNFEFLSHHCPPELLDPLQQQSRINVDPKGIVMEGLRQIDELQLIQRQIPDTRAVFRRVAKNEEVVDRLNRRQRLLWDLIGPATALSDLLSLGKDTKFQVLTTVSVLLDNGWIAPLDFQELLSQAQGLKKKNDLEGALQRYTFLYDRCEELQEDPHFLEEYGEILYEHEDRVKARDLLARAVRVYHAHGENKRAWSLGLEVYKQGAASIELYRTLWDLRHLGPQKMVARLQENLVAELQKAGHFEELEATLAELQSEQEQEGSYWAQRGENQRDLQNPERALEYLERAIELFDERKNLDELIRVLRVIYDLDQSRSFVGKRIQELLVVQAQREEQKRRRFTHIGAILIALLVIAIYPLHYELSGSESYSEAVLWEAAHAKSEDLDSVLERYLSVKTLYPFSTSARKARSRIEELRVEENKRLRNERDGRIAEQAKAYSARMAREAERDSLFEAARSAKSRGDYSAQLRALQTLFTQYTPLIEEDLIRYPLYVDSEPRGAAIVIDGVKIGQTPFLHEYVPGAEFTLAFERAGCLPQTRVFSAESNMAVLRVPMQRSAIAQLQLPAAIDGIAQRNGNLLHVPCRDGYLYAIDTSDLGKRKASWLREVGFFAHPCPHLVSVGDALLSFSHSGVLEMLDQLDGKRLWHVTKKSAPTVAPALSPHRRWVAVATEVEGLELHSLTDGEPQARFASEFPIECVGFVQDRLWLVDRAHRLFMLSLPDLEVLETAFFDVGARAILDDGAVLLANGVLWTPESEQRLPAPATRIRRLDDGFAYGSSPAGWVLVQGGQVRQGELPSLPYSPPQVLGEKIIVSTVDNHIRCLDALGKQLWHIPGESPFWDVIEAPGGSLLLLLTNGKIQQVEGP